MEVWDVWSWDVEMWFLKYRWGRSIDDGDVHGRRKQGGEKEEEEAKEELPGMHFTTVHTVSSKPRIM